MTSHDALEELRRVRGELEEANARHAELYDFGPVGYLTLDPEGAILGASLRGADLLGAERGWLTGRRLGQLVAAAARKTFGAFLARVFAGNGPEACEVPLAVAHDPPLHVRIEAVACGHRRECLAAVIDISGRVRAEEALRESERRERARAEELETLLDAVPTPVFIAHDPACLHITGNRAADELLRNAPRAEASLSAPADVRPRHFRAVKDGRELGLDELPAQRAARGEPVRDFEFSLEFDDGTVRHVVGYGTPLLDEQKRPRGAVHVLVDVTDRRRAEEELRDARDAAEAADRAKSEFLARMSHEMRTPLNGIVGMTELALAETSSPRVREYLTVSKTSTKHLLGVIHDVLDLAKIEAGGVEVENQDFELGAAVDSVLSTLGVLARSKGLRLESEIDPRAPGRIRCDRGKLAQVLVNIIGNAIKFTERGGVSLAIGCAEGAPEAEPDRVRLVFSVTDTGIGIPAERIPEIFKSFTQANASHHATYGGTGLGLTISKQLVELMGGRLRVDSEPGAGSTFSFTLDVQVLPGTQPEPLEEPPRREQASVTRPLKILIAEDNPVSQLYLGEVLRRKGHEVVAVETGREALDVLAARGFDLVLMDVQMPEMDGVEAARVIRGGAVPGTPPDLPIVALTAHALAGDRERFLQVGMDDYLSKPIAVADLEQLLARWADRSAAPGPGPAAGDSRCQVSAGALPERLRELCERLPQASVWRLVGMAIEEFQPGVDKLAAALEGADAEALADAAHGLKGAWITVFGPIRAVEIVAGLERLAREGDLERCVALLDELRDELPRLSAVLDAERRKAGF